VVGGGEEIHHVPERAGLSDPVLKSLVEAAARPRLEALGAATVEAVVRVHKTGGFDVWVGYTLKPGVGRTQREMKDALMGPIPGVDVACLNVVPASMLPLDDPELVEAKRKLRNPKAMIAAGVILALVGVLAAMLFFNRGDLLVRAELGGPGQAVVQLASGAEGLELWASLDGHWTQGGDSKVERKIVPVRYEVDFVQAGRVVKHLSLDTREPQVGGYQLVCSFAPDCDILLAELPPLPPGPVEVRVTGQPRSDVTEIEDMSLEVRAATWF
jgi:hypothetical protein